MQYRNLTIIGTSHIAKESIAAVTKHIEEHELETVALELDLGRLRSLLKPNKEKISLKDIRRLGVKGYLFGLAAQHVEVKLGAAVGVRPGDEMLAAYRLAKKSKIHVALVDQDIKITLRRLSKYLTWKEKFRFAADLLKNFFSPEEIPFDLNKVPPAKVIAQMMERVKDRYPNVHRVLVTERNEVMAANLFYLMQQKEGEILCVMGAGHEGEVIDLIDEKFKRLA